MIYTILIILFTLLLLGAIPNVRGPAYYRGGGLVGLVLIILLILLLLGRV